MNNIFVKLVINLYIYIKKIFCMVYVLDSGINSLSNLSYKKHPILVVDMAKKLIEIYHKCNIDLRV